MTEETQALVRQLWEWVDGQSVTYASVLMQDAAAALTALARDLETARACPDCQQPLACPAGTAERIAGLEAMHEETLTRAERAEADLAAARQERNEAQSNYDGACRTIALMHEAATGRSGEGPHLGVVEDVAAAVRAARAETWAEAAAWHEGMAESSVIPSLRPLHQQYAANFRERARLVAREEQ